MAQNMNGQFVPIIPGGGNTKLTFQNRKEYVEKVLCFRLHELDQHVSYRIAGLFRRAKVSFFGERLDFVGFNSVFPYN